MPTDLQRGRPRCWLVLLALITAAVASGCSPSTEAASVPDASNPTQSPTSDETRPATSSTTSSTTATTTNTLTVTETVCELTAQTSLGPVENNDLLELSGLLVSPTNSEVLWAHNDSGSEARLFRVGFDGTDLGYIPLLGDASQARDLEDIAVSGRQLVLADVGDNLAARDHATIYLIPEPDSNDQDQGVSASATIEFTYSTGPTDVEAVFVDPIDGAAYLLAKDRASNHDDNLRHPLYRLELNGERPDGRQALEVGAIELPVAQGVDEGTIGWGEILKGLAIPLLEVPTGADISADGSVIAVRTYTSIWLFQRHQTESVAEALRSKPCGIAAPNEAQGEAIALIETAKRDDGSSEVVFVTSSEGKGNALTRTAAVVGRADRATS